MALHDTCPGKLLGDSGYDSADIRDHLTKQGIEPVIRDQTAKRRSNTRLINGATSSNDASIASSSSAASPPVTKKLPGPIFQC
jgi:hypothetical protein